MRQQHNDGQRVQAACSHAASCAAAVWLCACIQQEVKSDISRNRSPGDVLSLSPRAAQHRHCKLQLQWLPVANRVGIHNSRW
jgi:hypothetical protein